MSATLFRSDANARKPHILVVEDEQHLAIGIKYNLDREGYRVTAVGDGPAALRVVADNPQDIDLVILDLMLPGMSGYAVCEQLRADGNEMPVLILSARTLSEDRTRGFDVGANQYLMKPFELEEFISRVKNLLSRPGNRSPKPSAPEAAEPYAFGQAVVDFKTFQATVRDEPVRLTAMEVRLLEYFIAHENRVIPRHELLEEVWGMAGSAVTRAPDQFIRRLRKLFEIDPASPRHFLTVRDAGYRFVAEPDEE